MESKKKFFDSCLQYWDEISTQKKLLIIFVAVLLVLSFYWYEYRPMKIRIECTSSADAWFEDYYSSKSLEFRAESEWDNFFGACLNSKGLN